MGGVVDFRATDCPKHRLGMKPENYVFVPACLPFNEVLSCHTDRGSELRCGCLKIDMFILLVLIGRDVRQREIPFAG